MPGEQILVDPRLVVEPIKITRRHKVDQVLVAFLCLSQQDEVVIAVLVRASFVSPLRHVHLAAYDGMDSLFIRFVVELNCAEEIAMVGHGDGRHTLPFHNVNQLLDVTGTIKKGVISVAMKMNERSFGHEDYSLV